MCSEGATIPHSLVKSQVFCQLNYQSSVRDEGIEPPANYV